MTSAPDRWQDESAREPGSALRRLAAGIGDALPGLRANIWRCIHPEEARLVDAASARLAEVRAARARNRSELRSTLDGWGRAMLGRGASERAQVRHTPCLGFGAGVWLNTLDGWGRAMLGRGAFERAQVRHTPCLGFGAGVWLNTLDGCASAMLGCGASERAQVRHTPCLGFGAGVWLNSLDGWARAMLGRGASERAQVRHTPCLGFGAGVWLNLLDGWARAMLGRCASERAQAHKSASGCMVGLTASTLGSGASKCAQERSSRRAYA